VCLPAQAIKRVALKAAKGGLVPMGLTVEEKRRIHDQYRSLLLEGMAPFWLEHGIDRDYGGVLSCMTEDGQVQGTDKFIWSQARSVWTFAALYAGFMAVPDAAGGKRFRAAMLQMAKSFHAQPGPRIAHADDQAIGQTYLDLYQLTHDPELLAPIRERMDAVMRIPDDSAKPLWWWCDALFMAPPVLAKLSRATGDVAYLNFMDREWWVTADLLYSQKDHLFFRDRSFLNAREANGKSVFWSRGNGWVFAGLARVLAEMPQDFPTRPRYVALLRQMADEIASLQMQDGLWRAGLLDESAYRYPEVSGSAFFTYGIAYGINAGLLDRRKYKPVVKRAWQGLLTHVFADGRLGSIQPIGAAPGDFTPTSSYVYGSGAFLLAGSELDRLAR